jgi:hypothetical protein
MFKALPWARFAALTVAFAITTTGTTASATPVPTAGNRGRLDAGPATVPPSVALGTTSLVRQVTRSVPRLQNRFRRSEFMEDTPREIAMENRANPLQAWALAFFPTAIIKGVTLGLAFSKAGTASWAAFLPLVPSMGISHFWETKFYWAGAIALAGDIAGSAMVSVYFSQYYSSTAATRPSQNMLWGGIGVMAVAWLFENITAPLFANWRNSKLREQFLPSEKKAALIPTWRTDPLPNQGNAQIGPPIHRPVPIAAGYTFSF